VFDEIQCGMGRTGTLWAYEQTGVVPDAMAVAKALGGGLPIGAVITNERFAEGFEPGDHGSTFAGGPVACSAALAVLDVIEDPALLARVRDLGEQIRHRLAEMPGVVEVRGRGFMLAADLAPDRTESALDLVGRALRDERLVINATGPTTIRLLPPLTMTDAELDDALERLGRLLDPEST
jgi:acetylornithine/succinyldiaminopimelate/putrescine aminotransferase